MIKLGGNEYREGGTDQDERTSKEDTKKERSLNESAMMMLGKEWEDYEDKREVDMEWTGLFVTKKKRM